VSSSYNKLNLFLSFSLLFQNFILFLGALIVIFVEFKTQKTFRFHFILSFYSFSIYERYNIENYPRNMCDFLSQFTVKNYTIYLLKNIFCCKEKKYISINIFKQFKYNKVFSFVYIENILAISKSIKNAESFIYYSTFKLLVKNVSQSTSWYSFL